jgi:hypothetical protein
MHDAPMWPIHGHYQCRVCGRQYPVPWSGTIGLPARRSAEGAGVAAYLRPAQSIGRMLWIALAILLASSLRAADAPAAQSSDLASLAFARYTTSVEQTSPWNLETVEIDAALPQSAKKGRLRAIRRLLPLGAPQYQVLELAGDGTVKQQVIGRYISAEVRAAAIPASATAITPANYKFRYKRSVQDGDSIAYVFLISPRKKADGLIKGELWLDGQTGAAVRQTGYLVKNPSIFIKRIDVTRETTLTEGIAQVRTTHLSVDIRFVGRAELTIQERPCGVSECVAEAGVPGQ